MVGVYTDLRSFSFFIKVSNRHARAEAEVFSADHTVHVLLQVLEEAIRTMGRREEEKRFFFKVIVRTLSIHHRVFNLPPQPTILKSFKKTFMVLFNRQENVP